MINLLKNLLPSDSEHVTIELREVVKDSDIFDRCDPFPIWDENHRGELEKKIIEHYYFRQIGFETVGRFKFMLNVKLREIMPRMIKIYKTTLYKYNPIENYNMEEGSTDERSATDQRKTEIENLNKYADTPQGELQNLIDGRYLTNATHGTDKSNGEDTHKGKDTHSAWRHGNIGVTSTQELISQERKVTIDVDMMIIDELKELFLGVY